MAELLDLDNSEWRRCPVMISSGWILSGKFVRFQTRLRNARTNSTARSAISHVGQRGRRVALESPHNACESKKAEQSSTAMPAIHRIPASPKVSVGDAAYRRSAASISSSAMVTPNKYNKRLRFTRVRAVASDGNADIQFCRPHSTTARTAEATSSKTDQGRALSFANSKVPSSATK